MEAEARRRQDQTKQPLEKLSSACKIKEILLQGDKVGTSKRSAKVEQAAGDNKSS